MTKEEAIKNIKEHCYFANLIPQAKEALDMSIKALEQEPILDKIKRDIFNACCDSYHMPVYKLNCDEIFGIIDKYKSEGENK